jgi:phage gp36-like protein
MYATLATMTAQFGEQELIELTDTIAPYTGEINLTRLQAGMDAANSEVDGYLCTRYATPVDPAPPFLVKVACDLAHYHACTGAARLTERDEVRHKAAVDTLRSLSKGTIGLGAPQVGAQPVPTVSNEVVFQNGRCNDFGRKGW